jgi:hypothetical protein
LQIETVNLVTRLKQRFLKLMYSIALALIKLKNCFMQPIITKSEKEAESMKHHLYLAAASLIIAVSAPSAIYAQPSGTPNPASIPDPGSSTPSQMTAPSTSPTPSTGADTAPSAAALPTSASTGMCSAMSSGTSMKTPSSSVPSSASAPTRTMPAGTTMPSATPSATVAATSSESVARLLQVSSDQVEYNNLIGPAHYIKLSVGSSPLCYLTFEPLQDVSATDSIKVLDQSGNTVNTVVTKQDNGGAKVSFEQPVAAGSTLTLALQGVEYSSSITPTSVQYSVSGGFADYSQDIPYGIAQVKRFLR